MGFPSDGRRPAAEVQVFRQRAMRGGLGQVILFAMLTCGGLRLGGL